MPFEPFGYRFAITSPMSPSEAKMAIRSRKKGWLNPQNGARGWIVGPFICLWFSALDRHGPMLFGVISDDGMGTRVRGRAGADLNGVVMMSLLLPLLIFLDYKLVLEGNATPKDVLLFTVLILVGGLLFFWMAHTERRSAEPLVRFLRDTLTMSGKRLRGKSSGVLIAKELVMTIGGERFSGAVTPDAIHDSLINIGADDFMTLEAGPETYIQAAFQDGAYIVEKRDGGSSKHFRAIGSHHNARAAAHDDALLSFEEVHELFMAYASQAATPRFVTWKPINKRDQP